MVVSLLLDLEYTVKIYYFSLSSYIIQCGNSLWYCNGIVRVFVKQYIVNDVIWIRLDLKQYLSQMWLICETLISACQNRYRKTQTKREIRLREKEVRKKGAAVPCVEESVNEWVRWHFFLLWEERVREAETMLTASPVTENYSSTTAPHKM